MKENKFILDKDGNPIPETDLLKWAKWFETADRVVKKTEINGVVVSTVFLGLNHNFFREGEALIYETMIFGSKDFEDFQERYATRQDALMGHFRAVELVKKNVRETQSPNKQ